MTPEELKNEIDAIKNSTKKEVESLRAEISLLLGVLQNHIHSGYDGSSNLLSNLRFKPGSFLTIGSSQTSEETVSPGETGEVNRHIVIAGKDVSTQFGTLSVNSQNNLEHQPGTTGGTNQTFYYGIRPPLYSGTASISTGGSTLTDVKWNWTTNQLANAWLNVYDGTTLYTHLISSNTATVITISDTFSFTNTAATYLTFVPTYLGSADYPWRRVYTATDIRFGIGQSGGTKVCFIKHGTGTPESAVTAQVGSLFLRLDGGASTTLYVKESGTGNTGWRAV